MITGPLSRDRLSGVQGAAAGRGLWPDILVRNGDFSVDSGETLAKSLLDEKQPHSHILFQRRNGDRRDRRLAGARARLPPEHIGSGFRLARAYRPSLTTIRQPKELIGRKTVEIMLGILSDTSNRETSITLPHELIARESTGPCPTGNR